MSLLRGAEQRRQLQELASETILRPELILLRSEAREPEGALLETIRSMLPSDVLVCSAIATSRPGFALWNDVLGGLRSVSAPALTPRVDSPSTGWQQRHREVIDEIARASARRPITLLIGQFASIDPDSRETLRQLLGSNLRFRAFAVGHGADSRCGLRLPDSRVRRVTVPALAACDVRQWLQSDAVVQRVKAASGGSNAALQQWTDTIPDEARGLNAQPTESQRRVLAVVARLGPVRPDLVEAILGSCDDRELVRRNIETTKQQGLLCDVANGQIVCAAAAQTGAMATALPHEVMSFAAAQLLEQQPALAVSLWAELRVASQVRKHWRRGLAHLLAAGAEGSAAAFLEGLLTKPELIWVDTEQAHQEHEAVWAEWIRLLVSIGHMDKAVGAARTWHRAAQSDASRNAWLRLLVLAGDFAACKRVLHAPPDGGEENAARLGIQAEVAYHDGDHPTAERLATRAVAAAPDQETELLALQTLAKVRLASDEEPRRAYAFYLDRARSVDSIEHIALALAGLGIAQLRGGKLKEAQDLLHQSLAHAGRCGSVKALALANHNLAVVAHLQHRLGLARSHYETALEHLRRLGHQVSTARCAFNLGDLYLCVGAQAQAQAMADLGLQLGGANLPPLAQAEGLLLRGRIALAQEDLANAEVAFESASAILQPLDRRRAVSARIGLAWVALHRGDTKLCMKLAQADADFPQTRAAELTLIRYELECRRERPRPDAKRKLAERAVALSRDDPLMRLDALIALSRAQLAGSDYRNAQATISEAEELHQSLGATLPADLQPRWNDHSARHALNALLGTRHDFAPELVGRSKLFRDMLSLTRKVADSPCTVLILGESGTGKELVAEAIHRASARRRGPLVRINCAALVDNLLLSELFGHEKGAFTGATALRRGRFELAHGGTLFLDEIGDISPGVQAALLRVLQQRSFERVGGTQTLHVDVRIVAATHRDLPAMVDAGTFRSDLFYRLHEVAIEVPPLRARGPDIALLAHHFVQQLGARNGQPMRVSDDAMQRLEQFPWPGNVRQLENTIQAAALFADGHTITAADLQLPTDLPRAPGPADTTAYQRLRAGHLSMKDLKREVERECIKQALDECGGNITQAAEILGMKRPRLSQLVKQYGLRKMGPRT